ncbi:MAG TPA: 4-phosphoerythronate dehydrogenase [Bacteroidetes bacterium]|nr:4-phosphoerythronate dehydrogenase [Bacteroidota bacterium]
MRILADIDIPYLKGIFEPIAQEVAYQKGNTISATDLLHTDVLIIRTRTVCNESLLKGTPVSVIATATVGTDHIDTEYCKANGITVISAPGCNAGAVVQWTLSAIFALLGNENLNLSNKTLGIVGVGNIGSRLQKAAKALGFNVLICDPPREEREGNSDFTSLSNLVSKSDIISLHVPLKVSGRHKTLNLIDKDILSIFKPNAILLNSARGGVINEHSLIKYLAENSKLHVALDVWENEPNISRILLKQASITTPHIAGYSLDGKVNATRIIVKSLGKHFGVQINTSEIGAMDTKEKIHVDLLKYLNDNNICFNSFFSEMYCIKSDSEKLKENPEQFESFRNSYKLRREFSAYQLLNTNNTEIEIDWGEIGFMTTSSQ